MIYREIWIVGKDERCSYVGQVVVVDRESNHKLKFMSHFKKICRDKTSFTKLKNVMLLKCFIFFQNTEGDNATEPMVSCYLNMFIAHKLDTYFLHDIKKDVLMASSVQFTLLV